MTAEVTRLGPWEIEVDREATAATYSRVVDGAEACECGHCQHWAASRDSIYPKAARDLFADLGIDWRREGDVMELSPMDDHTMCSGWFHFIGRVRSGPTTEWTHNGVSWTGTAPDPYELAPGFSIWFSGEYWPMKQAFEEAAAADEPVEVLEFSTTLHKTA